jgi:lipid-binding SYLF domain-containing protein
MNMKTKSMAGVLVATVCIIGAAHPSVAQDKGKTAAAELTSESQAALQRLYGSEPLAKALGEKALAILVFPAVKKAGLGIGGQYGEGTLLKNGLRIPITRRLARPSGYRPERQEYGYAMFFMNAKALQEFSSASGFRSRRRSERRRDGRG